MRSMILTRCLVGSALLAGCVHYTIPESVYQKVDATVGFSELRLDLARYHGRMVALGGEIVEVRPGKDGTELVLRNLELDRQDRPIWEPGTSEGRFIVVDPEPIAPNAVHTGTLATVVGEVQDARMITVDARAVAMPLLRARFVYFWSAVADRPGLYSPVYPYRYPYYAYDPYYPPYGYYPYYPYSFSFFGSVFFSRTCCVSTSGGVSAPRRFGGGAAAGAPAGGGSGSRRFK